MVFKTLADTARMDIWISGPCAAQPRLLQWLAKEWGLSVTNKSRLLRYFVRYTEYDRQDIRAFDIRARPGDGAEHVFRCWLLGKAGCAASESIFSGINLKALYGNMDCTHAIARKSGLCVGKMRGKTINRHGSRLPLRYYRPGEKIYGNTRGQLLHCRWKGHNACLPDCVRNGLGVGKDTWHQKQDVSFSCCIETVVKQVTSNRFREFGDHMV